MQKEMFDGDSADPNHKVKKGGPTNRMNDLTYREWMKFQKSFLWAPDDTEIFIKSVTFFTKEIWNDGLKSVSLIIGLPDIRRTELSDQREIIYHSNPHDIESILIYLDKLALGNQRFDFILIDLRHLITNVENLQTFVERQSDKFFTLIKQLTFEDRYSQIIIGHKYTTGTGFPVAWSVAQSAREFLRLRDEKISLHKETGEIDYFLFFQNSEEQKFELSVTPDNISYAVSNLPIPNYTFPKPPPRKKNEILHPAKFPETLISDFIERFTSIGDNVFDPMVGTGSSVIAANRIGRNGYGIDLSQEFINIAKTRISNEHVPSLFLEYKKDVEGKVFQGDSTHIDEVNELKEMLFDYVITSPPYWSMLNNPGGENQKNRKQKGLKLAYSVDTSDLGNVVNYSEFLQLLLQVYVSLAPHLKAGAMFTVIVKNVKREHILYPLAWDIVRLLCDKNGKYEFIGNTFWLQDDIPLKPFAVGTHWVSNILHQYCLHFRRK